MPLSNYFSFLYPEWLFALPAAWILVYKITRFYQTKSSWQDYCDPQLLDLLIPEKPNSSGKMHALLIGLILSTGIVALAGPSWKKETYPALETALARVLVLDLSQSMLVQDVKPDRLTSAVTAAQKLLSSSYEGETGLVVFSGSAFQVAPLTRDKNTLTEFLKALTPDSMPEDGNRLHLALARAGKLLSGAISGKGSIIVFSDGFEKSALTISMAKQQLTIGNRIYLIPIGTDQGGPLINRDGKMLRNDHGQIIIDRIDRGLFLEIAQHSNGAIFNVVQIKENPLIIDAESENQEDYSNTLNGGENLTITDNGGIFFVWLLLPLVLLLFRKNALWMVLLFYLTPYSPQSLAFDLTSFFLNNEQRALRAFNQSDYAETIRLTKNRSLEASAQFYSGDFITAYEIFSTLDNAVSLYNSGNTLVHLKRYPEALTAYEQALSLDKNLIAARQNIVLVRAYLEAETAEEDSISNVDSSSERTEESSTDSDQSRSGQSEGNDENQVESIEAGIGASFVAESTRVSEEQSEAAELALALFMRQLQQQNFNPNPEMIKAWAETRKTDPSDFFKRKFLRDYRRNQSDGR